VEPGVVPDDNQLSLLSGPPPDPEEQRVNLLALSRMHGLGEASLKALISKYRNLALVWDEPRERLWKVLFDAGLHAAQGVVQQVASQRQDLVAAARRDLDRLARQGTQLITELDETYPARLRDLDARPRWLFVQGDQKLLSATALVAVVGTREATPSGLDRARLLTRWLAERGCGIVSGLADGIDQSAHEAALDYSAPTVGVLGTGIQVVFPADTAHLRRRIVADGGAIVTEYFPADSYSRSRFVRRNRIQAGLSYATVPVEGAAASGTAHTYRFAREYGRITFGVVRGDERPNGIVEVLREDGQPIFDLESEKSMAQLEQLLRPILATTVKPPNTLRVFRTVLQEFERIATAHRPSSRQVVEVFSELEKIWMRVTGGQGGHPRS
jgi:DNA protecting protein DprA